MSYPNKKSNCNLTSLKNNLEQNKSSLFQLKIAQILGPGLYLLYASNILKLDY